MSFAFPYSSLLYFTGHHECEILSGELESEAAESGSLWRNCKKNPGHEEFISAKDFKDKYLPRVHTDEHRDRLRAMIDLTVRLRVRWTSPDRPDDDPFSYVRGKKIPRMGTGFIYHVPVSDEPCVKCNGEITRKFWRIAVHTAHHVVYNTEEAKSTSIDLFYDDDSCKLDGRMVTVTGLEMAMVNHDRDVCVMMCVTHDEALVERISSAWSCWYDGRTEALDLSGLDCLPSCDEDPVLIVSHPHGQPKKITLGQWRDIDIHIVEYNAPTCPGSSGAPVFRFYTYQNGWRYYLFTPVHSRSSTSISTQHLDQQNLLPRCSQEHRGCETKEEQLNYGNRYRLVHSMEYFMKSKKKK